MQEDPYKLVVLAKDYYPISVTRADLFFAEGRASIISCDEEGVLRLNEYDPHGMFLHPFNHALFTNILQTLNRDMDNDYSAAPNSTAKQSTEPRCLLPGEARVWIRKYHRRS